MIEFWIASRALLWVFVAIASLVLVAFILDSRGGEW